MSREPWRALTKRFEMECGRAGLDLVHPFALADYNLHVAEQDRLPDFGRDRTLALLVGNTRALWPVFVRAWQDDATLAAANHPLDTYVTRSIEGALEGATALPARCHFSHVTAPRPLPIQRAAELSGFAQVSPSHLAIHPVHGPWFSLRALVVVDCEGPENAAPAPQPCHGCSRPCVAALERALAVSGPSLDGRAVTAHAAEWIAVRTVCPVGRRSGYGEDQLRFHYGMDRRVPRQGS